MKQLLLFSVIILIQSSSFSQDSIPPHLKGKIKYPAVNVHFFSGVIDVEYDAMKYDPSLDYKIAIDVYDKIRDSTKIHSPISEVARVYNLNIANEVPKEKLKVAAVIHGYALDAILNNEAYEKKYKTKNPNADAISQLKAIGVHFYVCGQNMGMFNVKKEELLPEIEVALSAKNALIILDQRGYTYLNVNWD